MPLAGDNSVDQMDMMTGTPPQTQHATVSGKSLSDGTAVSCQGPSSAYQVRKPEEAEASLRALQELPVHKCPGETSFIEVRAFIFSPLCHHTQVSGRD